MPSRSLGPALLVAAVAACGRATAPPAEPVASAAPPHHAGSGHAHGHGHGAGHEDQPMHHRFEHAEQWTAKFDDPARDAWQRPDAVIGALGLTPAMTVADVGAGTGYFAVRLAKAVPAGRVIATDIEPDMVRYLTERAAREGHRNVTAALATTDGPGLAPASADRILIVDVWHHLGDRVAYAKAVAAALRPGGAVMVVDFKLTSDRGPPAKHRLVPQAIVADLEAAGLSASVDEALLPDQYVVTARRR